ncbi:MAG TPA: AsmA family protein [Azospirillaceae bacterium]|nr:AsmA family protein [Azospirillaceae bacterium]
MRRALLIVGLVLVVLVVGGAVLIVTMGPERLARYAADRMTETTGRKVEIAGPVDIDWSLSPRITLGGITMANAEWGSDPLMARVGRMEAVVKLLPLLTGRIDLPEVIVAEPWLLLEKNAEGVGNWVFDVPAEAEAAAEAVSPEERSEFPVIGTLAIEEGQLIYRDPKADIDIDSRIHTVVAEGSGDRQVRLDGSGTMEGKPLKIEFTGAPLITLRETEEPYPLKLAVSLGKTSLTAEGTLTEPVKLRGVDLRLALKGPNLAETYSLVSVPLPPTGPYHLNTRLIRREAEWRAEEIDGKVGESDLSGWLSVTPQEPRPVVRAELVSKQLRLADLGGFIGMTPGEEDNDGKLIPDTEINLERLRVADMDISFSAQDIEGPVPMQGVKAGLKLENGRAVVQPFNVTLALGTVGGSIVLNGREQVPSAAFDIDIRGVQLKPLFKGTPFEEETEGTIGGHLDLQGSGKSLAGILGNADGESALIMQGGRFSTLLMEVTGIDLAEALGFVLTKDQSVPVRCMVAAFDVEDGVMKSKTLVFDTEDTNVAGEMTIGLAKETLDGRILAHPKDASIASARTPITFGGTFSEPEVGVEAGPLAAKGAAAVALGTLLTPLAALIPLIETGGGEDSPCQDLIREARDTPGKGDQPRKRQEPAPAKRP